MRPPAEPAWHMFVCCSWSGAGLVFHSVLAAPVQDTALGCCRSVHINGALIDGLCNKGSFSVSVSCHACGGAVLLYSGVCHQDSSSAMCRAPKALINTCIRHARSNLGIDLSSCSQWMRFLEVHYQRPASTMTPPAMETSEVRTGSLCLS